MDPMGKETDGFCSINWFKHDICQYIPTIPQIDTYQKQWDNDDYHLGI